MTFAVSDLKQLKRVVDTTLTVPLFTFLVDASMA